MRPLYFFLNTCFALVWLINGLYCKVLNQVPRHEAIVRRILSLEDARPITLSIGLAEIAMAVWILTSIKPRLSAVVQVVVVMSMNLLEFFMAPDLLLWERLNLVFALFYIILVLLNEFYIRKKLTTPIA